MMQHGRWTVIALWAVILAIGAAAPRAQEFQPSLGLAREVIAGPAIPEAKVPSDLKELGPYALPPEQTQELLTEVPRKPFRQAAPAPLAFAWWKLPFYLTLGFPRDMVDSIFGALNFIPFLNIPLVVAPYELVPTQVFFRDPRDWHRWPPTRQNARGHGLYDGNSWGWFPSANTWHFTYPSPRKARKNTLYNAALRKRLQELNRKIEELNLAISARAREARNKTLEAIQTGNGQEAARRMMAYRRAYPLDEGSFALLVTGLALYAPGGPEWVRPLLWNQLQNAQPRLLTQAEKLLATTAEKFPDRLPLAEALIYTRLLLGQEKEALAAAEKMPSDPINNPHRLRLVFETALAARDAEKAQSAWTALQGEKLPSREQAIMEARLNLLKGQLDPALKSLAELQAREPEDPYLDYFFGSAELLAARKESNPAARLGRALPLVERAQLAAPGPALRNRAGQALAYARNLSAALAANPELFPAPEKAGK